MGQFTERKQIPCGMTCPDPKKCREQQKCLNEEKE